MAPYTRPEFEAFALRQRRAWRLAFFVLVVVAAVVVFAIGLSGSYLTGLIVGAAIALIGLELLRRWNRERWRRHFPELRGRAFPWSGDHY